MSGVTVANPTLAATFHCEWENISPTDATLVMSTIAYLSPTTDAARALITTFRSSYNAALRMVSAFTRSGETQQRSRFEAPPFPELGQRCTGFEEGDNLKSLLANTAAEVAYFARRNLAEQPLIIRVKGRYVQAVLEQDTGRGTIVKVVLVDSRIGLLESKSGEYIHVTNGGVRYTRLDRYEESNIQSGTLIVYVTLADPFPVHQKVNFHGQFDIPFAMERNLISAYERLDQLPDFIMKLVRYIGLCTNPIVEGLPHQAEYLDDVWKNQDLRMLMDQVVIALDIYDPVLLSKMLSFVGLKTNVYLREISLPLMASHLGFYE